MGKLLKYPESEVTKEIEKDGLKVKICVHKAEEEGWILEIVDEQWHSTVFDDLFPSSKQALNEGIRSIEEEGIESFIGKRS
jgi:hypothetical protein